MPTISPVGLLLDVDGPLASTETRTVPEEILDALAELARRGVPVGFNTGRTVEFLLRNVIEPLRERVDLSEAPFHGICEKGAVWFPFSAVPAGDVAPVTDRTQVPDWVCRDEAMVLEDGIARALVQVNEAHARGLQEEDRTKLAMVSFEMGVGTDPAVYEPVRDDVARRFEAALTERGAGERVRVDPTVISVDVEDARSGKDLGVQRCRALLAEAGVAFPERWFTVGDSRTDYAMADALHAQGFEVQHVDVRPADGIPEVPYPVVTAAELAAQGFGAPEDIHERVGASLLRRVLADLPAHP
ncbi:haloacid dehalogenase [Micrococcus sp.]|uniref:haloacid dehalogenase n=1 Tax=Micrococcus sp. TaxID=1271 RepID=UPI002A91E1BC|nr:haloacid dehalogenase [Micrococcus sp.]MDY6056121.1 haloacid dehalogenase [Micrococcus sp.]